MWLQLAGVVRVEIAADEVAFAKGIPKGMTPELRPKLGV